MTTLLAPSVHASAGPHHALRRLLREEDAWLLRQIGSERPVVWLRPQPLGAAARHGILALRVGSDGSLRGALRASAKAWPWADDSIPAIVLQHVVEGSAASAYLLAESARVLAPEGRLYILRFDRFSPWYWRYGRNVVRRSGSPLVTRPIEFHRVHRQGLALEYRHSLGARGLRKEAALLWKGQREPDTWPFASMMRAARVWVMRKRRQSVIMTRLRDASRSTSPGYGLAVVRRERQGADS